MKTALTVTRKIIDKIASALLWVLAILGISAIGAIGVAAYYDAEVVLFSTGSMEPTIQTGAAAIAIPQDNEDIEVGDIMLFDPGRNADRITHRVIDVNNPETIEQVIENQYDYWTWEGEADWYYDITRGHLGESTLVQEFEIVEHSDIEDGTVTVAEMQGDANDLPDARPYLFTEDNGLKILWNVPYVAPAIAWLQQYSIWLFGLLGALLTWALWPKDEDEIAENDSKQDDSTGEPEDKEAAADSENSDDAEQEPATEDADVSRVLLTDVDAAIEENRES